MVYAALDLGDKAVNPIAQFESFADILNLLIPLAYIVGGLLFAGMMIYAGFRIIIAQGDPKNLQHAQNMLKYSVIGLAVIICSYLAVQLVKVVFPGINLPL